MSDIFQAWNTASEIWGLLLCAACVVCNLLLRFDDKELKRNFLWLFGFQALALLGDVIAINCDGHPGEIMRFGVIAANTLSFAATYLAMVSFANLTILTLRRQGAKLVWWKITVFAVAITGIGILIWNLFDPIFFTVTSENVYRRAEGFWFSQVSGLVVQLMNLALILRYRKKLSRVICGVLVSYLILPDIAMLIQLKFYGLSLLNISMSILMIVCFIAMMADANRTVGEQQLELAQRTAELADTKAQIMLSQIQPHFLYNSLNTIYYLCGKDPRLAQKAVSEFSDYLRVNLSSLENKGMILFSEEMKHVKTYLWMEQLRFGERLKVVYNIQCEDFRIPALTIQPLVENAVKHGICQTAEGGTVVISAVELKDRYEILINDTGKGFNEEILEKGDERSVSGIPAIAHRLEAEAGGTLEVHSVLRGGTTAKISMPKKD